MPPIVSIHQPGYLPWLGYFEKIARSDIHVFFDDVQFEKNSFDNRNKILTAQGELWLTVPVLSKGHLDTRLSDIEIDTRAPWAKKHWKTITMNYSKCPYFSEHASFFEQIYNRDWKNLLALNIEITTYLLKALGISTKLVYSSKLQKDGKKSDLVLSICKNLGAGTYLSGTFGKDYLELEKFQAANIQVLFQDYEHPVYKQHFEGFVPYMSVIDLLFNEGKNSLDILMNRHSKREVAP